MGSQIHDFAHNLGFREIAKIKQIDPNRYKLQNNEFLMFGLGWLNSSTDAYFVTGLLKVIAVILCFPTEWLVQARAITNACFVGMALDGPRIGRFQ